MSAYPEAMEALIEQFRKLPSIGRKTAQRLALAVVEMDSDRISHFADALEQVRDRVHRCPSCGNWTDQSLCAICADPRRDRTTLCVVEDATNLLAMENGGAYHGLYFVLHGLLSPMRGVGPEDIGVEKLLDKLGEGSAVQEVILAISPTVEGETTMLFLASVLEPFHVKVTRIASGIPVGGSLEYYDELTLAKALEDRRSVAE